MNPAPNHTATGYGGVTFVSELDFRPKWVFPRLCCLEWAVALVQVGGPFWFEDGPSLKGVYDSRRGQSPCPRCDGFRHKSGFCGQCGEET